MYICELDYHMFFLWIFKVDWTILDHIWRVKYMDRAFIYRKLWIFLLHDRFCHATNFGKLASLLWYVMWMKKELLLKLWVCWANLDEVHHPQSWRGHMRSFWEISPFSWSKHHLHQFYLYPSSQVMHKHHIVLRERKRKLNRKKTPNLEIIICELYWLLNLALKFESYIWATLGTISQNQ